MLTLQFSPNGVCFWRRPCPLPHTVIKWQVRMEVQVTHPFSTLRSSSGDIREGGGVLNNNER